MIPRLIIAIDGYSSCGKSTFAKKIASVLNYIYIDTGAMYRAVTYFAIQSGSIGKGGLNKALLLEQLPNITVSFVKADNGANITCLNGNDVENEIRSLEVSQFVSQISAVKEVRTQMVALQRNMGYMRGVVLDGRDIGTVVFPNAEIKLFMTADPNIRAQRRFDELLAKDETVSYELVLQNIVERDALDTSRAESPLTQAPDAIVLDNSYLTPDQQLDWFMKIFNNTLPNAHSN